MSTVTRYMHSAYVKKSSCPELTVALEHDMHVFGDMMRQAFAARNTNRDVKDALGRSYHVQLKSRYGVNDYFANSAYSEAKAVVSSQEELAKMYLDDVTSSISASADNLRELQKQLHAAQDLKKRIISATKSGRNISRSGISGVSCRPDGTFRVYGPHGAYDSYASLYLFEHQWLDPRISRLKSAVRNVQLRIRRLECKADRLKKQIADRHFPVRFGTQKIWHTDMPEAQRKKIMHQKKYGRMQISGRKDAKYGNFVFRYHAEDRTPALGHPLFYTAIDGKKYSAVVSFPYGQEDVDASIGHGRPCAWTVIDCGNAWRFDCVIRYAFSGNMIDSWQHGCFGCDINWDRIAVTETDGCGNFLGEKDYRFHLEGLSSGAVTAKLSAVLDEIFRAAKSAGKSLAFEDISRVKPNTGFSKSNLHISLFAYQKMRELILYKEQKYGLSVRFINPAYTSQTGKLRYMRRYGLSVHGSASFVIARRGLGFTDKIPKLPDIPKYIFRLPRMKQWKSIYRIAKAIKPSDLIKHTSAF
ncbi:MAG: IS200/IS605 family accessory protein TnpB-related protein [Intestinibaculum porci]|uniref:IS200/IS605 family accessory protein TnpB-related protein n=1 Tax=Intestinibaculum porci TaxID=2487118 RepID=UPI003F0CBE89